MIDQELILCDTVETILSTNPNCATLSRLLVRLKWLTHAVERQLDVWRELDARRFENAKEFGRVSWAALLTAREVPEAMVEHTKRRNDDGGLTQLTFPPANRSRAAKTGNHTGDPE